MKRIIVIIIVITTLLFISCNEPTNNAIPYTPQDASYTNEKLETKMIAEWRTSSKKTTETFVINNAPWAVSWSFAPDDVYGASLSILARKPRDTYYHNLVVNLVGRLLTAEKSYVYDEGVFYLEIEPLLGSCIVQIYALE